MGQMGQSKRSNVLQFMPGDLQTSLNYYYSKLCYETDSYDVYTDLQNGISEIVVVDVRSEIAYAKEHIPGAINIPHRIMNAETTASLDSSKVFVVYCDGIGCNGSTKGAAKLTSLGFKVKELLGGIDWWKRDGYPVEGSRTAADELNCGC